MSDPGPASSVLVVGGGVFGVAAALALRGRGHAVTLLDPGPLPHPLAASTDISKLVRMDYGDDRLYTEMMYAAMPGWRAWNSTWARPLFHEDGCLLLAGGPMAPGGFEHDSLRRVTTLGVPVTRLDPGALTRQHPQWAAGRYPDGYRNPQAGWAESGAVVAALAQQCVETGVTMVQGAMVALRMDAAGAVSGCVTDAGEHAAAITVVAAGAWTPSLLPWLGDRMQAVGQPILHFRPADPDAWRGPPFPPWAADIAQTGWYGFPANADGLVKVGHHGAGLPVDPAGPRVVPADHEARCRRFLRASLPALANAPLAGGRLCLYCDTFDGDFFIDHDPDHPGLVVATGGSGHGFKFAPLLGPLIADVVEGRPNPWAPRFRWRSRQGTASEHARFDG